MRRKSALALVLGLVGLAAVAIAWDIRHRERSLVSGDRPALGFRLPRLEPPLEKRAVRKREASRSDRVILRIGSGQRNLNPQRLRAAAAALPDLAQGPKHKQHPQPTGPRPKEPVLRQEPPNGQARKHVVREGDSLGTISSQYYGTIRHVSRIKKANGLTSDLIRLGQELIIPAVDPGASLQSAQPQGEVGPTPKQTYTVRRGDSLIKIATEQLEDKSRWKEIQELNHLPSPEIHIGQLLLLPQR
ncbi:MAG: LysM peptidoglycan-binding domain-containing protein [Planctomycetota bacterium]